MHIFRYVGSHIHEAAVYIYMYMPYINIWIFTYIQTAMHLYIYACSHKETTSAHAHANIHTHQRLRTSDMRKTVADERMKHIFVFMRVRTISMVGNYNWDVEKRIVFYCTKENNEREHVLTYEHANWAGARPWGQVAGRLPRCKPHRHIPSVSHTHAHTHTHTQAHTHAYT